ncbi:MAG: hypothetical protein JXD23_10690 [Spirochaetales bacterium]|nr:hypothetical protein [Spirochaetales bacterium]
MTCGRTGERIVRRAVRGARCAALLLCCLLVEFTPRGALNEGAPVGAFLSDNHAGHFFYLARLLEPRDSYCLLLFDAHPDAAPLPGRADVRRRLQDGKPVEPGRIQCYNWIHGLTPAPIGDFVWVPALSAGTPVPYDTRRFEIAISAWFPKGKATAVPFDRLDRRRLSGKKIVVSIDLDYFCRSQNPARDIGEVFRFISHLERVDCIAVAVSRPFLPDDDFADRCVEAALRELLRRPDVPTIEIGVVGPGIPDRSKRARELEAAGLPVPGWDLDRAPTYLKELVRENRKRFLLGASSILRKP